MKWAFLRVRLLLRFYLVIVMSAVTVITGMATGFELFYKVLYILGMITLLAYIWNRLIVGSLEVKADRRTLNVTVGEFVETGLTIRNLSVFPKHSLEVEDLTDLPGSFNARAVNLGSRGAAYWDAETPARRRGVYVIGPVRVANVDPFGLFRRARTFGGTRKVVVYPRAHDLPEFHIAVADMSGETSVMKRSLNVSPQVSTVRDYAFGDSLSRIHWNSTAKFRKLMSKEFDLGRAGEVWILPDLYGDFQAGQLEESTDEYSASIAASLAKRCIESQLPLGFVTYGDRRQMLPAETGAGQFERVMDSLAVSKAEGAMPLEQVIPREEPLWGHRTSLITITASPAHEWVLAIGELARRGVKVAVVLLDSRSFGASFNSLDVLDQLIEGGIQTYVVRNGDSIRTALSRPYTSLGGGVMTGEQFEAEVTA